MNWSNFTSTLLGALAGSGIVGVVFQVYLTHKFSKNLERFKTSLSSELFEKQTRFAWLHSESSKVLVRLYRLLASADRAFEDMVRPLQTGGEEALKAKKQKTSEVTNAFFDFFDDNRVFLDVELTRQIRSLQEEYTRAWIAFNPFPNLLPDAKEWFDAWERLRANARPLRSEIEKKVQEMLGVEHGASAI
jgi:hypothetical protein